MNKPDQLSDRLRISDLTIHKRPKKMVVKFDDPPGPSPARLILPIMYGQDSIRDKLYSDLKESVQEIAIGGVQSKAYTNETYAILVIALAGISGGFLQAIGQDIWNIIKDTCMKIFKRKGSKRNVLEIAIHFEEADVVLHFENRSPLSLPASLDSADVVLKELASVFNDKTSILHKAKTIELRQMGKEQQLECVLHSYRKAKSDLKELAKHRANEKVKKSNEK